MLRAMAPVLRERQTWKRDRPARATERLERLTPEQAANVRAALRVLRVRLGGWAAVGKAMGASPKAVEHLGTPRGRQPTAGVALHTAAVAGVPVEEVLSGAWPKAGSCPMCGRCD